MNATKTMAAAFALGALMGAVGRGARAEWQSIVEIRTETPERWTETYETPWRTVQINVPIGVPDVDAFPIVRVTKAPAVEESRLANYAQVMDNEKGLLYIVSSDDELAILNNNEYYKSIYEFESEEAPDICAENHPLTAREALERLEAELERLTGLQAGDFALEKTTVYDCVWKFKTAQGERIFTKPVSETGEYAFEFSQRIEGIPFRACTQCYADSFGRDTWAELGNIFGSLWKKEGIKISASLLSVVDLPHADVLMLSFEDAKKAFEAEIMAGRLRSIDRMELAYAPYVDPAEPDTWWLLPVWYVRGGYTRNAQKEFKSFYRKDGALEDDGIERAEVVFEAQKGVLMDYDDADKGRRDVPKLIMWEDIQQ